METSTTTNEGIGMPSPNNQMSNFDWIVDKNKLRDEGVYYGLSDSNEYPEEKIRTIRQYFHEQTQLVKTSIAGKRNELQRLNAEITSMEGQIEGYYDKIEQLRQQFKFRPHDFWRYLTGFLAYTGMLILNYWIIYDWLKTGGVAYPEVTTTAVYLFGAFSLFNRWALVYSPENEEKEEHHLKREGWKVYTEEMVIPLIAAAYVVFRGYNARPTGEVLVFFLLILSLFIFAGKGLLNVLIKLKLEFAELTANRRLRRLQKEKIRDIQDKIVELKSKIQETIDLRKTTEQLLMELEKSLSVLEAQGETHVALFLSEYELARAARKSMSNRQTARILARRH